MSARDDGGPAFPGALSEGATLRDYFAGQALIGAMSKAQGLGDMLLVERTVLLAGVAEILYEAADARIRERAK